MRPCGPNFAPKGAPGGPKGRTKKTLDAQETAKGSKETFFPETGQGPITEEIGNGSCGPLKTINPQPTEGCGLSAIEQLEKSNALEHSTIVP